MRKLLLLMLLLLCCAGCGSKEAAEGKLPVSASFFPMAEFTQAVGQEHIALQVIVPDGVEPHDWEPSPKDLAKLGTSKVFIYNGYVEPWAKAALENMGKGKLIAVEAGQGLEQIGGKTDPHVWISPRKALVEVERITKALCEADTKHAENYKQNSKKYCAELQKLDKELTELSKTAVRKKFVTAHAAFGHLAADYGLEQLSIAGISPEAEPTPKDLQELVKLVKQERVKYIFMETLASPKLSELLAKETGAGVLVLDPAEGLDAQGRKAGMTYLKLQQQNLANLKKALNERS